MADQWLIHRDEIRELYLVQGNTVNEVMKEMARRYGFHSSKKQYERKIKEWGIGKNTKANTWKVLGQIIRKRKRDGKESDVFDDSGRIAYKKLRRKIAECYRPTILEQIEEAAAVRPQTPDGFHIMTPPPERALVTDVLHGIPWFQCLSSFGNCATMRVDVAGLAYALSAKGKAISARPGAIDDSLDFSSSLALSLGVWVSKTTDALDLKILPYSHMFEVQIKQELMCLDSKTLYTLFQAYLPSQIEIDASTMLQKPPSTSDITSSIPYLGLFMYLLSNNLMDGVEYQKLMSLFLRSESIRHCIKQLLLKKTPTFESAAEKIFTVAVRTQDVDMIKFTLNAGVNTCGSQTKGSSILTCAVGNNDLDLVEYLIKHGDNFTALNDWEWRATSKEALMDADVTVLQTLLRSGLVDVHVGYGGYPNEPLLATAIKKKAMAHAVLLATLGSDLVATLSYVLLSKNTSSNNIVELLVALDFNLSLSTVHVTIDTSFPGETLLHRSARCGNLGLVIFLIIHGWDFNAKSTYDLSVLQAAIWGGDLKTILFLLACGAEFKALPVRSKSALLRLAVREGIVELAAYALDCGADANYCITGWKTEPMPLPRYGPSIIFKAHNNPKRMDILLDTYGDTETSCPNDYVEHTVFQIAVEHANVEMVRLLLQHGAHVDYPHTSSAGHSPLDLALQRGDPQIIDLVMPITNTLENIDNAAAVDSYESNRPLNNAIAPEFKEETAIQEVWKHNDVMWLEAAAENKDPQAISMLLDCVVDIDTPLTDSWTALDLSIDTANLELAQLLIDRGADTNRICGCDGKGLVVASHADNGELAKVLLDRGASLTHQGPASLTAAVRNSNTEIIQLLLSRGTPFDQQPAIALAAAEGRTQDLQLLLHHQRIIGTAPREDFFSELVLDTIHEWRQYDDINREDASADNLLRVLGILLDQNVNVSDLSCKGVLVGAISLVLDDEADPALLRLLLDQGVDVNYSPGQGEAEDRVRETAIRSTLAALDISGFIDISPEENLEYAKRALEIVRLLLQYGAVLNDQVHEMHPSVLTLAVAIRRAAHAQVQPYFSEEENRQWKAVADTYFAIAQLLLDYGADVNAGLDQALSGAVWRSQGGDDYDEFLPKSWVRSSWFAEPDIEIVKLLIERGANAKVALSLSRSGSMTPLQNTVCAYVSPADMEVIRVLLDAGADVNMPSGHSHGTALQLAAANGSVILIELLLDYGADINAKSHMGEYGRTALQAAVDGGKFDAIKLLIARGANINAPACRVRGVTALQAAAIHGYLGIVMLLLEHNADCNAPGAVEYGRTALEGAAEHGRLDIVKVLLNAGVSISEHDAQYQRAVRLAERNGHHAVARMIKRLVQSELVVCGK